MTGEPPDWRALRDATEARVGLATAGRSIGTRDHLAFQFAHAQARDAVTSHLDVEALVKRLRHGNDTPIAVRSRAPDRATFLTRPDLGRALDPDSAQRLESAAGDHDIAFVVADGLSAQAAMGGAVPLLDAARKLFTQAQWRVAPLVVAENARVALGDEIARIFNAALVVIALGERPGLSAPDSLGLYITWAPKPGHPDAERNCISNIRPGGLAYAEAANLLFRLCTEARRRKITGTALKDDTPEADQSALSGNPTSAT